MKKILLVLSIVFVSISIEAQETKVTTFHRMLILNHENELLVVKFKNKDLWVTPGLYQNSKQTIKQGIDSIAATYGINVYDLELRGVYGLKNTSQNSYSTRNMFVMKSKSDEKVLPKIIAEALWLDIDEAVKRINIPHITEYIKDVFKYPNNVRAGTVDRINSNGKRSSEISEIFYNINKY